MKNWCRDHARCALLLLPLSLSAVGVQAATVSVNKGITYQTILGYGGDISPFTGNAQLPDAQRDLVVDWLVNDYGLTRLRIDPAIMDWEYPINDDSDPYHSVASAYKTAQTDLFLNKWVFPVRQAVQNAGYTFSSFGDPGLPSGRVTSWQLNSPAEYSEWALNYLQYMKSKGLVIDGWCIVNEPAYSTSPWTPAIVNDTIKILFPILRAAGITTKAQYTEAVNPGSLVTFLNNAKLDPAVVSELGGLSYHRYPAAKAPQNTIRDMGRTWGIPTEQSEAGSHNIAMIIDDMIEGGVSYWDLYGLSLFDRGGAVGYGMDGGSTYKFKEYWRIRQVTHYARPGSRRVDATTNSSTLQSLAFVDGKGTTLVVYNSGAATPVTVTGLDATRSYGVAESGTSGPFKELPVVTADASGSVTMTMGADTVRTLYPYLGPNLPPTITEAYANPVFITSPRSGLTLVGTATDTEDPLSYTWTRTSGPGSVTFGSPNQPSTSVTGLSVGTHGFQLRVSDGPHTVTKNVIVNVFASNQAPYIGLINDNHPFVFDMSTGKTKMYSDIVDIEGDAISYRWSVVSQPTGGGATFSNFGASHSADLTVSKAGNYVVKLEAWDASHAGNPTTQTVTMQVFPVDSLPTIQGAIATPASITLPTSSTNLSASATDPSGDILSYYWLVQSAPAGTSPVIQKPGLANATVTGLTKAGTYVFTVRVVDRTNLVTKSVNVVVSGSGGGDTTPPAITSGPTATPATVTAKTSALSVLASDNVDSASALTYTWSGPAGVTFAPNGSNSAKSATATFSRTGTYVLSVVVTDTSGNTSAAKSVTVTVNPSLTVNVTPASRSVSGGGTAQFTASAVDQFGTAVAVPVWTWTVSAGGGSISAQGLLTASTNPGTYTVQATDPSSGKFGTAQVIISGTPPDTTPPVITSGPNANPVTVTAKTSALTVLASDNVDPAPDLIYSWSGPPGVSFSPNGTNSAKSATATFSKTGAFVLQVIATDTSGNDSAPKSVTITVNPTLSVSVTPVASSVVIGGKVQFSASALDQFGTAVPVTVWNWAVSAGGGSMDTQGLLTASNTPGTYTVRATDATGGQFGTTQVTVTAGTPPQVKLISPASGASYAAPATIALQATFARGTNTISRVQFLNGTVLLRTFTNPGTSPLTFNWLNVPAGTYALSVKATDSTGISNVDGPIVVDVIANSPPSVSAPVITPSDADPTTPGLQYLEGSTVLMESTVDDPNLNLASWQWYYSVNGGPRVPMNTGTAAGVAQQGYTYPLGDAGKQYSWILRATDVLGTYSESSVSVLVIRSRVSQPVVTTPNLGAVKVYPNPWRQDRHSGGITFEGLTAHTTVRILNIAGQLVRRISTDGPTYVWDRTNEQGVAVASGIYLYSITNDQGQKTRGKLALIH